MNEAASKILLVEDSKNFADLIRDALVSEASSPNYRINVVSRVDEALVVAGKGEVDLILLGLGLPNPDSMEAMRSLRVRYPGIPVVIVTRENDRAFAVKAIQSGARDCIGGDEVSAPLLRRVARYAIERNRMQRRLDETRTQKERETELLKLGSLCGPANLTATLKSLASRPLMDARPREFGDEIENYGLLLDRLLNATSEDERNTVKEDLHGLADRLGALNAGPRDVVEIHKAALSQKLGGPFLTDTNASIEEGRLLLLQLMGYLVSYYRRLSWGRRATSIKHRAPGKQTESKRREKD
jgi:DNA-binding response OmpR family regulator